MAEQEFAINKPKTVRVNDIAAATVPNSSTLMGTIHTQGSRRLMVEITVAVAALTGFNIQARSTPAAPYVTLYSATSDFTQPKGILVGASGDLTTQGVGTGWFIMDVEGLESVQIYATSGGTATLALNMGAI